MTRNLYLWNRKGATMAMNYVTKIDDRVQIRNVLVSVFDKGGLDVFIPGLLEANPGVIFYATGNSFLHLKELLGTRENGHLVAIAEYTGQPEMQGGLVKTLDYKIYLGLLSETYNPAHAADLQRVNGIFFDMVVVNLHPVARPIA